MLRWLHAIRAARRNLQGGVLMGLIAAGLVGGCGSSNKSLTSSTGGSGGAGSIQCASGQIVCDNSCVSTSSDAAHCGSCSTSCQTGQSCVSGSCTCQAGLSVCDGACVDLQSSGAHCGSCTTACASGQVCTQGQCATSCATGSTQCGADCVDLTSNVLHCGTCPTACGAGQSCTAGTCTCSGGEQNCSGTCVDTQTNAQNCGQCGTSCGANQTCTNGTCTDIGTGGTGGITGGTGGTGGITGGTGGTTGGTGGTTGGTGGTTGGTGGTTGGTGGTTGGTGGTTGGTGGTTGGTGGTTGGTGGTTACTVVDRLATTTVTATAGAKPGVRNWRVWSSSSLAITPVFTVPLANCGTLVCYTTGTQAGAQGTREAQVAVLDANDQLLRTVDLGAYECRGLAAEPDGHFAALVWAPGTASDCNDYTQNGRVYLKRYTYAGAADWTVELTNLDTTGLGPNCPTDWGIGDSRVDFGGGRYGAYYHVHSQSGHEGDTLKYVTTAGATTTQWTWGCSHSMSDILRYNGTAARFAPICVTDCYPGTPNTNFATSSIGGIYISDATKVMDLDGGCNGDVAGELGSGAPGPSGWKIVFNGHSNAATSGQQSYSTTTMNQDIGFQSISSTLGVSGSVVWLTNTPAVNEADSSIARFTPDCDTTEQYVVGWSEPGTTYRYMLGRVNASGAFVETPTNVAAQAKWGRRDDPFRTHLNGDVIWAWFDAAGSTTLHVSRVRSGGTAQCAAF